MKRFLFAALALVPLAGVWHASPTLAPPENECCICGAIIVGGEVVFTCPCTASIGGLSCTITAQGCRTNGVCTPQ